MFFFDDTFCAKECDVMAVVYGYFILAMNQSDCQMRATRFFKYAYFILKGMNTDSE